MGHSEVASQVGDVVIPQKAEEEEEKGCNYSLTCELCQKENKTLQSLYTHVIVLPCLLATNGKSGEEMQANLVQIKKEKAKIFAE